MISWTIIITGMRGPGKDDLHPMVQPEKIRNMISTILSGGRNIEQERITINHGIRKNLISMGAIFFIFLPLGLFLIIRDVDNELGMGAIGAALLIPGIASILMFRSFRRIPLHLDIDNVGIRFHYFMDMSKAPRSLKWEDVEVYEGYDSLIDVNGTRIDLTYLKPEQFDIIERYLSKPGLARVTSVEGKKRLEAVSSSMGTEPEHSLRFTNLEGRGITRKDWTIDRDGIRSTVHGRKMEEVEWTDIVNVTNGAHYTSRRSGYNTVTIHLNGGKSIVFDSREYSLSRMNELFDTLKEYCAYHDIPLENPLGF